MFQNSEKVGQYPVLALVRPNEDGKDCFLYCTTKSVRKSVDRNRLKRIMREMVRQEWTQDSSKGFDIGLIAGPEILELTHIERKKLFQSIFYKIQKRRKN